MNLAGLIEQESYLHGNYLNAGDQDPNRCDQTTEFMEDVVDSIFCVKETKDMCVRPRVYWVMYIIGVELCPVKVDEAMGV